MWRQRNHSASSGHGTMVDLTVFIAIASATGVADKASGRVGTAPSAIMKPPAGTGNGQSAASALAAS
jgi:hypothetical protein